MYATPQRPLLKEGIGEEYYIWEGGIQLRKTIKDEDLGHDFAEAVRMQQISGACVSDMRL